MQFANRLRLGTFGLIAILFTQTATAEWLDRLFRPAAFEQLAAPANEPQGNEPQGNEPQGNEPQGNEPQSLELPPPPEPLPPTVTEESILEAPELDGEESLSPYDRAPYEVERPSTEPAPIPWQESDAVPLRNEPIPHQHGPGGYTDYNAYQGLGWGSHHGTPGEHACCEPPKIKYWNHSLLAKEICSCHISEEITVVLTVPTDCCSVEVPVCITACCDSVPEFESGRDLLGRKTYEYCWPCGQRVKIVDRHTGTLVVHTFQRE